MNEATYGALYEAFLFGAIGGLLAATASRFAEMRFSIYVRSWRSVVLFILSGGTAAAVARTPVSAAR